MRAAWAVFYFLFLWANCFAKPTDSLRIISYKRHISLAAHLTQIDFNSRLENSSTKKIINYQTATATRLGISFDYRWLAFELFTRIPAADNKEKGTTQNSGVYFRANRSRYWANLIFQNFKGFYWENADPLTKIETGRNFPLRSDIRNRMLQANFFYVFSHRRFSNMGAQGENERQLRSGGSFFSGVGYITNRFTGDSSIVPKNQREFFPEQQQIKDVTNRSFLLYSGYAHSFIVKKKLFFSLYLAPGLARFATISRFENSPKEQSSGEWSLRLDTRFSMGYNTDHYFGGILLTSSFNNQDLGTGTVFSYGFQTFRLFFGRRFELKSPWGYLGL